MRFIWRSAALAAVLAVAVALFAPDGGSLRPSPALSAFECPPTSDFSISLQDATIRDGKITRNGTQLRVSPDPNTGSGSLTYVDGGTNDDLDIATGVIKD